jgi:hypothetical protein
MAHYGRAGESHKPGQVPHGQFAVAEATYMTYHLDWTVFLFAHTLAEVLDALAFILIFAAVSQKMLAARG